MPKTAARLIFVFIFFLCATSFFSTSYCSTSFCSAQDGKKLPREDVIDVPTIGKGLSVSNVFQSNMVIQRDKPVRVWGWAPVGEEITVTFAGKNATSKVQQDGSWKISLPACSANSQPTEMTIKSQSGQIKLDNILIGDVWLLGGQSNMEFPLSRIENGQLEIVSANYPGIRVLTVPAQNGPEHKTGFPRLHEWSSWSSRHFRKGDWDVCTPQIAQELSAIGYVFARRIHKASGIPVGIIDASRGGTTVETWTPNSRLRNLEQAPVTALLKEWDEKVAAWDSKADLARRKDQFQKKVARFQKEGKKLPANEKEPNDLRPGPAMDQNRPGNCYASMIAPLKGLSIKGAIFHQGYNNCFNGTEGADMYRSVFPEMIKAWRDAFNDTQLPFGILSLCTEGTVQTLDNYCEMMANAGPYIREAQYQTFLEMYKSKDSQIGFVSTYDLRRRWYHPQLKIPAGERIARWALATQYGFERQIRWKPPMITEMRVEPGKIVLRFDERVGPVDDGGPILGFAVAGADRKFQPATADFLIKGKDNRGRDQKDTTTIVLSSPMVELPTQFRYAWGRNPLGNLQAERNSDIPVATQRSDDWPMEATPAGLFEGGTPGKLDRRQRRQLTEALKQQDLERKIHHAKKLLEKEAAN